MNESSESDTPTTLTVAVDDHHSVRDSESLLNSFPQQSIPQSSQHQSNLFRDIQNSPEKLQSKQCEEPVKSKRVSIGGDSTSPTKKQDQENKMPSSGKENTSSRRRKSERQKQHSHSGAHSGAH
jgi:hypothetical protein